MSLKTETIIVRLIYLVVVVGVVAGVWHLFKIKPRADGRDRIEQVVSDMVARHNASAQWSERFVDYSIQINGGHRPIYTIDVETALIANDPRPILFYGGLVDVKKSDAEYCVVFSTVRHVDITFVLRCDPEQAERALGQPEGLYAVVAAISDIQWSKFKVDVGHSRAPHVNFVNTFIANGVCLDFSFAGRNYNPWHD